MDSLAPVFSVAPRPPLTHVVRMGAARGWRGATILPFLGLKPHVALVAVGVAVAVGSVVVGAVVAVGQ